MRCRKAKAKIESADWTDADLMGHLRVCPSCAKLAQAQTLLDSAVKSVRQEPSKPSDILALRASLAAHQTSKERSIMSKISNAFAGHRRLGYGLVCGVFLVLFLTLVPLPYERISGYNVTFAGVDGVIPGDQMQKAMSAVGYGDLSIKVTADDKGAKYEFTALPSLKAAREVAAAFEALTKTTVSPRIMPNIETVSASLYAQARNRMIQIQVDGTGKSDEQIKAEIEAKLAAEGSQGPLVYVKTDTGPGGKKQINLKIEESGNKPPEHQATIEIDTKGKTDEQVKAEVEAKLAAQGHPNSRVNIHSEGADSSRKVEIRIEESDTTGR